MPYFFLSYARTPKRDPTDKEDPDRWVYKLYQDLRAAILQMTRPFLKKPGSWTGRTGWAPNGRPS